MTQSFFFFLYTVALHFQAWNGRIKSVKKQALRKQWLMTSETHPDFHLFEHLVLSHPTHSTLLENTSARTKAIKKGKTKTHDSLVSTIAAHLG